MTDEQASADEEAWKKRFAEKRDVIRRLAQQALDLRPPDLSTCVGGGLARLI
jgi:hypothetical protein